MAGTLVIDTLNASSGVLSTNNGMSGIAKAWAIWTGSTGAVLNSFNVSSVTRNSTGNYTVNMTTAMPNTYYVPITSAMSTFQSGLSFFTSSAIGSITSTSAFAVYGVPSGNTTSYAGQLFDNTQFYVAVFSS